jgi:hypothetical protein
MDDTQWKSLMYLNDPQDMGVRPEKPQPPSQLVRARARKCDPFIYFVRGVQAAAFVRIANGCTIIN